MFVFSVKAEKKHLLAALVCTVVAVTMVVLGLCLPTQSVGGRVTNFKAATAQERVALLNEWGYTVELADETVQEIRVPDEPDEALRTYEALQTSSGLSLLKYSGKRVKLYTYAVSDGRTAHVYCYRDRVVAGDITANGTQKPLIS